MATKEINKGGRPPNTTKYTEEEATKIIKDYLAECIVGDRTPYIEEFAVKYLGVDDDTVVEYSNMWDGFSAAYKKIKTWQKYKLMTGDGAMKIFQLKANHGMVETSELRMKGEIKTFSGADYIGEHNDKTNS